MVAEITPSSLTWRSPLAATIAAGSAPVAIISANTSLARRPEIVPSAIRSISAPNCSAETGEASISTSSLLSAPNRSPMTQLAAAVASRGDSLEEQRGLLLGNQHAGVVRRQSILGYETGFFCVGQLGQLGAQPRHRFGI